ncbi:MAG: Ig-like domain-containing protein, partial [Bacteroidales bacterium]|nr:Ig-like domain-containing protein [Bacteroidales bacterium]
MAQNSTVKKGQCINFGNCSKANAKEVMEINLGDDFICPECSGDLMEIQGKTGTSSPLKWILIIAGGLTALGAVGYFAVPWTKIKFLNGIIETFGGSEAVDSPEHAIIPDGIELDKTSLSFKNTGESEKLTAAVYPDNASEESKKVTWSSKDETVVKVDATGLVTAVANGSATVSASLGNGLSASCYVKVGSDVKEVVPDPDRKEETKTGDNGVSGGGKQTVVTGGTYKGETKGGKPHGMGTIHYSSRTLIDSRDIKKRYA